MDIIVIGGSVAGLKAACRIRRLQPDARVRVLVRSEYFAHSVCGLPYYLSGDVESFNALLTTPNGTIKDEKYFRDVKDVDVYTGCEVVGIDRAARSVRCYYPDRNEKTFYPYDRLVIATGTNPIMPVIQGTDLPGVYTFTTAGEAIKLRGELEANKIDKVTIIGAGFIGLELCEAFRAMWGVEVDLVDIRNQILPGLVDIELAMIIEDEIRDQGIKLRLGCGCHEVIQKTDKLCMSDRSGNLIESDRIVIAGGVIPNVDLAHQAGLEIGVTGGIKVNDHLQTSDPDIYAAGDCVELSNAVDGRAEVWSLGSLASRMGRVVGDNICNGDSRFGPVVGTTIVKMFDMSIGSAGLTRIDCEERGYEFGECWGTFYDRPHYYPGAGTTKAKIIYDKSNSRLLGFQAVSNGRLVHTLNLAVQAIRTGGTLEDLSDIEHAYAPPFSQQFETLHFLTYIAENSRIAGIKLVSPLEFSDLPDDTLILDVRISTEIEGRPLDVGSRGIITIPVEELRSRLSEVPDKGKVVAVCQTGCRAWDAALMLRRAGFSDVGILAGGALFLPAYS